VAGAKLAAVCSRDQRKLAGDWRGIKGNFGPEGTQVDLAGVATYRRLEEMLADPDVDLVDLCLPPGMHADAACAALAAGKHVLCEKPMALSTDDCRRMTEAANQAGRLLLIGHVLPFFPEYAAARQIIDRGKYGRLLGGHFKRIISDPTWIDDFYDPQRVGGPLLDLHVHDAHFIRLLFGMPRSVVSQGRMRGEVVEFCNSLFQFADPKLVVAATTGVINQQGRPFTHAFEIHLERATLVYDFAVIGGDARLLMPLTVLEPNGQTSQPQLNGGDPLDAFQAELAEVLQAVQANQPSGILDAALARDAVILCQKQAESVQRQQPVSV